MMLVESKERVSKNTVGQDEMIRSRDKSLAARSGDYYSQRTSTLKSSNKSRRVRKV